MPECDVHNDVAINHNESTRLNEPHLKQGQKNYSWWGVTEIGKPRKGTLTTTPTVEVARIN